MRLPGPGSSLASALYLLLNGGPRRMVPVLHNLYKEFGSVVEVRAPHQQAVVIFDPEIYMQVHRAAGSCPWGATDALWMLHAYFESESATAMAYGTPNWMNVRRAMHKHLLVPTEAAKFLPGLASVAGDASELLRQTESRLDSHSFLQRLSFEMICTALFGRRMGALQNDEPLLEATVSSMQCASGMLMSPLQRWNRTLNTRLWREWVSNLDYMLERTQKYVLQSLNGPPPDFPCYVSELQREGELPIDQIIANVPGLMLAGFETVASSVHWVFLHLARNPTVQQKLHVELDTVLRGDDFSKRHLQDVSYLRAVLRETHRLTPTAFSFLRKLDADLEVFDATGATYKLPAHAWLAFSPVGLSRDPSMVESPMEFRPARFLTTKRGTRVDVLKDSQLFEHPLMRDGFGFGPRMCLGARVAQLELLVVVSRILQDHRISCPGDFDYDIANHASTYPMPSPPLVFTPR